MGYMGHPSSAEGTLALIQFPFEKKQWHAIIQFFNKINKGVLLSFIFFQSKQLYIHILKQKTNYTEMKTGKNKKRKED